MTTPTYRIEERHDVGTLGYTVTGGLGGDYDDRDRALAAFTDAVQTGAEDYLPESPHRLVVVEVTG